MDPNSNGFPIKSSTNRFISPFPTADRRISPQNSTKYLNLRDQYESKDRLDTNFRTYENITEQSQLNRRKPEEDTGKMSIAELNLELDNNMNEMLYLINRRKQLILYKRKKLKDQFMNKGDARTKGLDSAISEGEDATRLGWFTNDPEAAGRVISMLVKSMPNLEQKKMVEEEKSNEFWNSNKRYENEIDLMLSKLKQIDYNLEKQTNEVAQICRTLDTLEDSLKDLLTKKGEDHLRKAQPLFANKKKTYEILNSKISERERIKDEKIEYIKKIRDYLAQLKIIRQRRVKELYDLFGVDDEYESDSKINFFTECADGLEDLFLIREKSFALDFSERELSGELEQLFKIQQNLYAELIKKQSDEARAYQNYQNIARQRSKYNSIFMTVMQQVGMLDLSALYSQQTMRKFKVYRDSLKGFAEEDRLIKQGLLKTNQTSRTFANILKATENQKERRKQLLNLLETCSKLKNDQEQKKQILRNLNAEVAKKAQHKNHIEEQLENVMTDGDLESYKKVGSALQKCDSEIEKLHMAMKNLEIQIDQIDRQIVAIAGNIKRQYDDILRFILPSNYDLNLRTSDDIKQVKNYIRKTYKRVGLIPNKEE